MVIINREFLEEQNAVIPYDNRGTFYGDGVFETLRCFNAKSLLFEEHYFRLMSSMRILRMDIPAFFTPEFLEDSILELLSKNDLHKNHARIRISVWRKSGGWYAPNDLSVNYSISCSLLEGAFSNVSKKEIDLFKDHFVYASMLSTLKTTNKAVNVLAGIYASENEYDDLLLLNQNKMVVEAISGNLFLRNGDQIKTPPIDDGCLNGIMRTYIINQLKKMLNYHIVEETITPFELQRADEIFTTNMIKGVQSITQYRKKSYTKETANELIALLNESFFD
ncbi:aminotransferase class IV [Nonlabens sp.]|uniref:aminotransferase class IV n=1 Tax=Nonlabens sp. TaxID=1888209 RepID=UPI001BCBA461|nr:aminotransferase class IV [Nonlabens sp.]